MSEKSRPPRYSRRRFRAAPPAYSARDDGPDSAGSSRQGAAGANSAQGSGGIEATNPLLDGRALLDEQGRIDLFLNLKERPPPFVDEDGSSMETRSTALADGIAVPPLNIVIFIVGSRGDVQPYLALALRLITSHSHRVRVATHGNFKDFVLGANRFLKGKTGRGGVPLEGRLEFADVGGDPKALMSYMVKNPGLLPSLPTLFSGEVGRKRKMTAEMMRGFYRACFYPDSTNGDFAADAIISNPPAFAHVSIAEALGLPLLLTFTMPWTATKVYQHPLVNVRESNADSGFTNYMSFALADILMFQGLGDVVNEFRTSVLGLEGISDKLGPSLVDRLRIPWTYCWNEALLPRPRDWKHHIDLSGFYFMENDSDFQPTEDLAAFLDAGPPPLYIGFGSIVIDDPRTTTMIILEALKHVKVRVIIHSGWAGLGKEPMITIPDVFVLTTDVPHDWLFAEGRVAAVCHHGGAGTTAIGLREGVPTIVVPFFGDQPFWGHAISRAGAGPEPIPFKELTFDKLANAITFALSPGVKQAAAELSARIREEDSLQKGVDSFHRHLPVKSMLCDIDPSRVAVWWCDDLCLKLSAAVVGVLLQAKLLDMKRLRPHRSKKWDVTKHSLEPFTGAVKGLVNASNVLVQGTTQLFYRPIRGFTNMTYGTMEATFAVVGDIWQGFDNIPGLIGSPVREVGPVTSFGKGMWEGTKGVGFGLWDGITGLVTEPIHGGFQEGAKGVAKGIGRSYLNLIMRPIAGTLGLFVHPTRGGYHSIRNSITTPSSALRVLRGPRESAAVKESALVTPDERAFYLKEWERLQQGKWKRRRKLNHRRNRLFLVDKKGKKVAVVDKETGQVLSPSTTTSSATSPLVTPGSMSPLAPTRRSSGQVNGTVDSATYFDNLSAIEENLKSSYIPSNGEASGSAWQNSPMASTSQSSSHGRGLSSIEEDLKSTYNGDEGMTLSPIAIEPPSPSSPISPTTNALINAIRGPMPQTSNFSQLYDDEMVEQRERQDSVDGYRPEGAGWRGGPITPSEDSYRFGYQERRDQRRRERQNSA